MSNFALLKLEYGAYVEALADALIRENETDFFAAMDNIVHLREPQVFGELRKLTGDLQKALDRFSIESRLADIAENEIPDARERLDHVIRMTDEAAHRTLDLVEQSGPLAERTAKAAATLTLSWQSFRARTISPDNFKSMIHAMDAFLPETQTVSEQIRRNLAEVLMAQGYQDLTGQIIRGVMKLVGELESALADLTKLSGDVVEHASVGNPNAGHGPVVPGVTKGEVASGQTDVDELLSGLGM